MNKLLLSFSLLLSTVAATAQTYSSTGSVSIPDGGGTCGTDGTPAVSSISVPLSGTIGTPSDVTINVNMTHAYMGDLRVELVAPDASSCILMNHVGATVCEGSSSTLTSANTLSFNATYLTPIPSATSPVPSGNYAPTSSAAFPAVGNLTTFLTGKSVSGTWSLRAIDNYGTFVGTIDSWNMVFGATALPLELLSFTGSTKGNYNHLHWASGLEKDIAAIELERNINGTRFELIRSFLPQGSYSQYECSDPIQFDGVALYRLKIVERDGGFSYSPVVKLASASGMGNKTTITPNPVKGNVVSLRAGEESVGGTAQLLNSVGQVLQRIAILTSNQSIDISAYPPGVYYIKLDQGESIQFVKMD